MIRRITKTMIVLLMMAETTFAAHPLITDDTGTIGKGKIQIELNSEFDYDKESAVETRGGEAKISPSYGINDTLDVILGIPYSWSRTEEDGMLMSDEKGMSDMTLELKWRFYEKDGLSLGLKPGLTLPTGNEDKGLGTGRVGYGIYFLASQKICTSALHLNAGYIRNEYKLDADKDGRRQDLWHISLAGTTPILDNLLLVADIGMDKNSDKNSQTDPAFALVGLIWAVTPDFDADLGFKMGLTQNENDYAILAGLTMRY